MLAADNPGASAPKTAYNPYLKENFKLLGALDFIAELTQHIPARGLRTIRYYGLYSSRSRAKWPQSQHVVAHAPAGWRQGAGLPSDAQAASTDAGTSVPSSRAVHLDRVRGAVPGGRPPVDRLGGRCVRQGLRLTLHLLPYIRRDLGEAPTF